MPPAPCPKSLYQPKSTFSIPIMDPAQYPQHEINSSQHQPYPGLDIDAVLSARMNNMALKYEAQLDLFKSSLQDQFITATQQSEIENGRLREELARLQAFQHVAMEPDIEMGETAGKHIDKRTRDPRPRPSPAQPPTKDPRIAPKSTSPAARITVPVPPAPMTSTSRRSSGASSRSKSTPQVLCLVVVRKHSI
ncbi:hypothetical protein B0H10DRAFT_1952225 [Mycena sp. CBHHK59/15]|nr:hypothetical protein B0H10DRAFT_1952225 [Mycena sp. CBHHK59/15]